MSYDVMEALKNRGLDDLAILRMSDEDLFSEFCDWHGLIGWGPALIKALDEIKAINKQDEVET